MPMIPFSGLSALVRLPCFGHVGLCGQYGPRQTDCSFNIRHSHNWVRVCGHSSLSQTPYWLQTRCLFRLFSTSTCFHTISLFCQTGWVIHCKIRVEHGVTVIGLSFSFLKNLFHRGDRAMIYLFIAGSYTPWLMLKAYDPPDGWASQLKWQIWVLAFMGILYQQAFHEKYKWLETTFYVIIGLAPSYAVFEMVRFRLSTWRTDLNKFLSHVFKNIIQLATFGCAHLVLTLMCVAGWFKWSIRIAIWWRCLSRRSVLL